MGAQRRWELFLELHAETPQQGPGSRETTERALRALPPLPASPHIVDMGCGSGRAALALARLVPDAKLTAVDLLPGFVDELASRAEGAGLADRIEPRVASMLEPGPIVPAADVIWCEGAIYNVGVEPGLRAFAEHLAPHGLVAFSELSWRVPVDEVPDEPLHFWQEAYPGIETRPGNRQRIVAAGFEPLGDFVIPESDWLDGYYAPLDRRAEALRAKYGDDPDLESVLEEQRAEVALFQRFHDVYGYVFYLARRR